PLKLFLKSARSLGYGSYLLSQLQWFLLDYQRNAFGVGAPTDAVLEVGGSPPEDFERIVRRYVAASPFTARSARTRLRAAHRLVKALLRPAPDMQAIARRLELPERAHAKLAADSDEWLDSHDARAGVQAQGFSTRLPGGAASEKEPGPRAADLS